MDQQPVAPLTASALEASWVQKLEGELWIVSRLGWFWMALVTGFISAALSWSILGSLPTKIAGRCILIMTGGVVDVTSNASGRVVEVSAKVGDYVQKGQQIALLAQPELDDRILKARARLQDLEARRSLAASFSSRGRQLNDEALASSDAYLHQQESLMRTRVRIVGEQLVTNRQLLEQGLVTRQSADSLERDLRAANLELQDVERQLAELAKKRLDMAKREKDESADVELQVREAQRELEGLEKQRGYLTSVDSPFAGRVVELKSGKGMLATKNGAIASIERIGAGSGDLEAIMFVPAGEGKKIERNAQAEIVPSTVEREDKGFVRGAVRYVSDYPATAQSLAGLLANEELVRDLGGGVAPYEVRIALEKDPRTGHYQWSRDNDAAPALQSGTLCEGAIRVKDERPLGFVLPAFKR